MRQVLVGLLLLVATGLARAEDATCVVVERVTAALTNVEFWIAPVAQNVAAVACYCQGTCAAGRATFMLTDRSGAVMPLAGGGNLSCSTGGTNSTFTAMTGAFADLSVGEGLRFNVMNTPTSVDKVTLCVRFTY